MIPTSSPDHDRPAGVPGWTTAPPRPPSGPPSSPGPAGADPAPPRAPLPPPPDPPVGGRPWVAGSLLPPPPDRWTTGPAPATPGDRPGLSLQHLLLGLGTALVAVATVVFTAVNWDRMGATVQALFLVAASVLAGGGAAVAARRRLPATAEALGLVALLLALADAHAFRVGLFPGAPRTAYWAGALVVVSLSAWAHGAAAAIGSSRAAAAVLGQIPLLLALAAVDPGASTVAAVALLQVAVVVVLVGRAGGALPIARVAAGTTAAIVGGLSVAMGVVDALASSGVDRRGPALVLALGSAVLALVAWLAAGDEAVRPTALGLATALGLGAAGTAGATVVPADLWLAGLAVLAATVVAVAVPAPPRWGRTPASVAGAVAGIASVPILVAVSSALVTASEVLPRAWDLAAGREAASLAPIGTTELVGGAVGLHLLAVAVLVGGTARPVGRRVAVGLGVGVASVAVLVVPLVAPVSLAGAAGLALGAAAALVAVAVVGAARPSVLGRGALVALAPYGLALTWAAATPELTLGTLAVGLALAILVAAVARRCDDAPVAIVAGAATVLLGSVLAGLAVLAPGGTPGAAWAAGAAAAAVLAVAGTVLLDPDGTGRRGDQALARAAEVTWWTVQALALGAVAALEDASAARVVLGVGALALGLGAGRPGQRSLGWAAAGHALVLVWLQLAVSSVAAPEPYALPLAGLLLALGVAAERAALAEGRQPSSWSTSGPALVVAAAPTVALAFVDPGLVRPLAALAVATGVLAVGALHGRRAPVDVGTAVVVLIGLRQLAPVVGDLPNWATIGASGAVLLAVGASFEQRRRDVHEVRDRYRSLV